MSFLPDANKPLERLLALKRHEPPPPGYFTHFSGRVIAGIENENLRSRSRWFAWIEETFQFRPILACAGSVAVVLTTVFGHGLTGMLGGGPSGGKSAYPFDNVAPFAQLTSPEFRPTEISVPAFDPVVPRRIIGFRSAREPELPGFSVQNASFGVEFAGFQRTR